jgi:hypothetical protein
VEKGAVPAVVSVAGGGFTGQRRLLARWIGEPPPPRFLGERGELGRGRRYSGGATGDLLGLCFLSFPLKNGIGESFRVLLDLLLVPY